MKDVTLQKRERKNHLEMRIENLVTDIHRNRVIHRLKVTVVAVDVIEEEGVNDLVVDREVEAEAVDVLENLTANAIQQILMKEERLKVETIESEGIKRKRKEMNMKVQHGKRDS